MTRKIVDPVLALLLGVSVGVVLAASTPPPPAAGRTTNTITVSAAGAARGLCIQNNTGLPFYLPLVDGRCPGPSGSNPGYWLSSPPFGIVAAAGQQGPAGPQGPTGPRGPRGAQGPAGDSSVVAAHDSLRLSPSSPASQTLVVTGLPAWTVGRIELAGNNAEARPTGSTVTVSPLTPASGSTSRAFTVAQSGLGSHAFTLTVTVVSFR
jgi:hypothetical protein